MAIIRWKPWNLSSVLEDDWDFPTLPGLTKLSQGLNIYETEGELVAEAALPGIPDENIDVSIEDGVVRITGSSSDKVEEKTKRRYFMSSISSSYNYSFRVPEGMITEKEPTCELDNGVLKVVFTKPEKKEPKKLQVRIKPKIVEGKKTA